MRSQYSHQLDASGASLMDTTFGTGGHAFEGQDL